MGLELEIKPREMRQARILAWTSCNGVGWLFAGAGGNNWSLLVLCCVAYLHAVGIKFWYRKKWDVRFVHFLLLSLVKLLIVFGMFYILQLVPRPRMFRLCVVLGYVVGLVGEFREGP